MQPLPPNLTRSICRPFLALGLVALVCGEAAAADKPFNPFGRARRQRYKLYGVFDMSDGAKLEGPTRLRGRKVFKIYDRVNMRHREFPLSAVSEVICEIGEEKLEKIWRWKEGGEHVKIDTGQSYPVRKFVHKLKLIPDDDEDEDDPNLTVEGGMCGVIFLQLSSLLNADDIADWPGFCAKLRKQASEDKPSPSKRMWRLLPKEVQQTVQEEGPGKRLDEDGKAQVTDALNDLLRNPDFYQAQDFAEVEVPEVTQRYLRRGPKLLKERQLLWLNRLFLDMSYPEQIRKSRVVTGGGENKLWYHETLGDKSMIGKKLKDLVYVKRIVLRELGAKKDGNE